MGVLHPAGRTTGAGVFGVDMRLEWVRVHKNWHELIDHEDQKNWWSVKYRSYNRGKTWQIVYPIEHCDKNHGLLQSEVPEEQLKRNLEMEYLLTREEA